MATDVPASPLGNIQWLRRYGPRLSLAPSRPWPHGHGARHYIDRLLPPAAREGLLVCSGRIIDASTPRAVDRSCRVPSRRLTKAPRERPTARGVLVAVIQPLQTKRSRCVLGFYRLAATATSLTIHTLKQSSCSQRALTPKVVTHAST